MDGRVRCCRPWHAGLHVPVDLHASVKVVGSGGSDHSEWNAARPHLGGNGRRAAEGRCAGVYEPLRSMIRMSTILGLAFARDVHRLH